MPVEIVPATAEHIAWIAPRLRPADREEIAASTVLPPLSALAVSLAGSDQAFTALQDGEPVVVGGVGTVSLLPRTGMPWLLATPAIEEMRVEFLRGTREQVRRIGAGYALLRNHVDARNALSIRWLRWLGFTLHDPVPFGPAGLPFHPFEMRP